MSQIVPARPLLALAILVCVLLLLAPTSVVAARLVPIALAAAVASAVADALLSWDRLDELRFATTAEGSIIRLAQRVPAEINVGVTQTVARPRRLLVAVQPGDPVPPVTGSSAGFPSDAFAVEIPAEARSAWSFAVQPRERGVFRGIRLGLETRSRLDLWRMRARRTIACELRVYPDLRAGRRAVLTSPLYRQVTGAHQKSLTGYGREFERLREYLPGDSYQDVSWKATARRGAPITRLYQWEQSQEVCVAIDHSRFSALPARAGGRSQLDLFIETALIAAATSYELGDRFGLIAFSDEVTATVPAGTGAAHFGLCRDALLRLAPRRVTPDFDALAMHVKSHHRRRVFLLILTNLGERTLAEPFLRVARLLRLNHVVASQSLLPGDTGPLFGPRPMPLEGGVEEIYRRLAGHRELRRLNELRRALMLAGVTLSYPSEGQFLRAAVETYLDAKRRQLV